MGFVGFTAGSDSVCNQKKELKSESAGHWDHIPTVKSYVKSVDRIRTARIIFSSLFSHISVPFCQTGGQAEIKHL